MNTGLLIVIIVGFVFVLCKSILVVPEGTVVMLFKLGKFHCTYETGLHIGWFDKELYHHVPLKPGTIAIATSETTIEVASHQITATFIEKPIVGSSVRIQRFEGGAPVVTHSGVPKDRVVQCKKCGHEMKV